MAASELAIDGGKPVLATRGAERAFRLRRGLERSLDLLGALPYTARGLTTIVDGSGPVGQLEAGFCQLTGRRHALAMNSGTATLHSAYVALGVGPGHEVIVPAYTWHASAAPVLQCSAVPVFCESDPRTLTLDPEDAERRITERTRVICVVHPWGNPADMDRIRALAERHGIDVIEDCSHAHGATFRGAPVGSFGRVGCFSLQAAKAVEGGEAGVAVTDEAELFDRMALLGHNVLVKRGQRADSFPGLGDVNLGVKYRPHLVATVLGARALGRLGRNNERAARAWQWLLAELDGAPGIRPIETLPGAVRGGWYAFPFEYLGAGHGAPDTPRFVEAVRAEGAPLGLDQFRGRLLHRQPLFRELDRREIGGGCYDPTRPWEENLSRVELPITERLVDRLVALPPWLRGAPESVVRGCGRAMRKVLEAWLPSAGARRPAPAAPGSDRAA